MHTTKIKSIAYLGKQKTYNLTMKSPQHNYALFGLHGNKFVIAENSHATAYTYMSSRLLWLKAHYPLEFFAAILYCEDDVDKIQEYRLEAKNNNIKINSLDINKSKEKFEIVDNAINIGFANIKGVGESIAKRIVAGQPYVDFEDFLIRLGTEAKVVKPIIALKLFPGDYVKLHQYYEYYKEAKKKFEIYQDKVTELKTELAKISKFTDFESISDATEEVKLLQKKYLRLKKQEIVKFVDFVAEGVEMDEDFGKICGLLEEAEKKYYGFLWTSPLERSPDYEGLTFDKMRVRGLTVDKVEICIISAKRTVAKKKKTVYWLVKGEDGNGESNSIYVWEDDWDRFKDLLKAGNLAKLELKSPNQGFNSYSLNGPFKHERWKLPKDKFYDFRVVLLTKGK